MLVGRWTQDASLNVFWEFRTQDMRKHRIRSLRTAFETRENFPVKLRV